MKKYTNTQNKENNNWRIRYINRLISLGYNKKDALKTYNAIYSNEIDYDTEPESATDDKVSY